MLKNKKIGFDLIEKLEVRPIICKKINYINEKELFTILEKLSILGKMIHGFLSKLH